MKFKKLQIIRHIRYYWYSWRVQVWASYWARQGIGLGVPNKQDREYLNDIRDGKE